MYIRRLTETGFCVSDLQRMYPELATGDLAVLKVIFIYHISD